MCRRSAGLARRCLASVRSPPGDRRAAPRPQRRRARTLIRTLQRLGYRTAIVSGGFSQITDRLAQELLPAGATTFPGAIPAEAMSGNIVLDVAKPLFDAYLIPFEATSVLLLAAVVGAVVLAKRRI